MLYSRMLRSHRLRAEIRATFFLENQILERFLPQLDLIRVHLHV